MKDIKKNIISGAIWSLLGQFGYVFIVLITNVVLSRILSPYIFGQIGIVMFFIVIFNVLVEGGMGGALIRKKEVSNNDYTTVFVFNLIISLLIFIFIVLFSGQIADYYKDTSLKQILIVSSLLLIINSFQLVHNIKLTRELKFKKKAFYNLVSIVLASLIGIFLAYKGFGVWSMVMIQLLNGVFVSLLLWVFEGGFGKIIFSKASFDELFRFGANTTIALMINTAFENIYQLVLGRYFSINQVGFFYQAKRLLDMPTAVVAVTSSGVVYSSLSKLQDDKVKFLATFNKILITYTVLLGLIVTLIFFYANNIILLLYGEKWIGATYYMKLLCVVTFFSSLTLLNDLIFKVYDQTKRIVQIMIIRNIVQTITILIGVWLLSLDVLIFGFIFSTLISYVMCFFISRKIINTNVKNEIVDLFKVTFVAVLIVVMMNAIETIINFKGMITFIFAPIIVFIYFSLIHFTGIINVLEELRKIKR